MYIQVIQAKVRDEQALRACMDRWVSDVEPGAIGWLGGTYGITDDRTFVGVVRFESEELAQANSERPEQDAWWRETSQCFDGEVTFHNCSDVTMLLGEDTDNAGFVQVIQGKVRDVDRMHTLLDQSGSTMSAERPDILSASIAIDDDGVMTETVSFTNEREAREYERHEPSEEARRMLQEEMALMEDVRYLDLHQPWFATHR